MERSEMGASSSDRDLVISYLRALQSGASGVESILSLHADDSVYVEHLVSSKGEIRTHRGKAAIGKALLSGMQWNPPDLQVRLDRLETEGAELLAHWTCTSAQFPAPMTGADRYTLRDGKISRLETRMDEGEPD